MKSQTVQSDIKNILLGLLVVAIITIIGFAIERYFYSELSAHYSIFDVKYPIIKEIDRIPGASDPDLKTMRIYLKNNTKQLKYLTEIEIIGVKNYYGLNSISSGENLEKTNKREIMVSFDDKIGKLVLSNLPSLESDNKLGIFLWGDFYTRTYVELKHEDKKVEIKDAYLVVGIEEFFARYWRVVIFATVIIFVFLIYTCERRVYELKEKK